MLSSIYISFNQAVMYMPLILGSFITISSMKIPDLSLESAFTAGAIAAYHIVYLKLPLSTGFILLLTLLASFIGGMIVGLVSSFLTMYCRFPHLLSSIITTGLFHGINLLVLGSCNASFNGCSNPFAGSLKEGYMLMIITLILYLIFVKLNRSQLGISFSIYGRNKEFFKRHAVSEKFVFMSGVMIANGLIGIAGFLCSYTQGFVDTGMGIGIALLALTSLIIGKVLTGVRTSLLIPLTGCLSYFVIQQSLLHVGFDLKYFTTVQACLVLVILVMYYRNNTRVTIDHLGV